MNPRNLFLPLGAVAAVAALILLGRDGDGADATTDGPATVGDPTANLGATAPATPSVERPDPAELERERRRRQREAQEEAAREAAAEEADRLRQAEEEARLALERFQERARNPDRYQKQVLEEIFEPIEEASERYAKHEELDDSNWFTEDRESNQESIDELLDQAIEVLEVSAIAETRGRLREAHERIREINEELARDREARLSASPEEELTALTRPFTDSVEDIDERIDAAENERSELEREIDTLEDEFVDGLRSIGVELDRDSVQSLLGTVSGDDFLEMCVAFDNIRIVTVQLQDLTEQAGESLDVARRYYGSYVVLVRIMDRIQKTFIERIENEQIPRLKEFEDRARDNIAQAERNERDGGDPAVAAQNIRSNRLTLEATDFYRSFLLEQARDAQARNEALQPKLRDALNTYDTVRLSSQVAELIREGQRNFSALLELEVPDLRGFENAELEAEFRRLTEQLISP